MKKKKVDELDGMVIFLRYLVAGTVEALGTVSASITTAPNTDFHSKLPSTMTDLSKSARVGHLGYHLRNR